METHKLSEETTNLESTDEVQEIQVFEITLKTKDLSKEVLENIDKVILYPILFVLRFGNKLKLTISYKKRNKIDENRMVIDSYYETQWMNENKLKVQGPFRLDLKDVYENIIRQLIPIESNKKSSIEEVIKLNNKIEKLKKEIAILDSKLTREKQFNRKVEINRELRKKSKELDNLIKK